jgi:hypothetical protein
VTGVVSRVEWANPRGYLYLSVKNDQGQTEAWVLELESRSVLEHHGWKQDTVKAGDTMTCKGGRSKTGARSMKGATLSRRAGKS